MLSTITFDPEGPIFLGTRSFVYWAIGHIFTGHKVIFSLGTRSRIFWAESDTFVGRKVGKLLGTRRCFFAWHTVEELLGTRSYVYWAQGRSVQNDLVSSKKTIFDPEGPFLIGHKFIFLLGTRPIFLGTRPYFHWHKVGELLGTKSCFIGHKVGELLGTRSYFSWAQGRSVQNDFVPSKNIIFDPEGPMFIGHKVIFYWAPRSSFYRAQGHRVRA